jgi:hypothetical protein
VTTILQEQDVQLKTPETSLLDGSIRFPHKTSGLSHISGTLGAILKEVSRRAALRPRLEAERGRPLSDEEFITIADLTGVRI